MAFVTLLTISNVIFEPSNGRVIVIASDGTSREFASPGALADYATNLDPKQTAWDVAFAVWKAKGMATGAAVIGKSVKLDLAAVPVTITVG